jgi:serine phosphatase RsbU (regulator of sigma subunit)
VTWSAWLIIALVLGGIGYLSLAGFVWANRQGIGSRPLVVMLLAVKVWSLCYALELSSRSVEVAHWWSALKYLGIVALPPALWSFVLAYTGRGRLSRRNLGLLLIHPVVMMVLLLTPATHDLLQVYPAHPDHLLGAPVPVAGPLFWAHAVYTYVLMLSADFLLFARLARIAPAYRRQGALLIGASLLPCFGNIAFNLGLLGPNMIDPTPFLFGITAILLVWGFFRLRLLDLTPVARGIVIEQMADGVLVLDVYGRVADVNAAGATIVGYPRRAMIGRYVTELIPGLASILEEADVEATAGTLESEVLLYPVPEPALSTGPQRRPPTAPRPRSDHDGGHRTALTAAATRTALRESENHDVLDLDRPPKLPPATPSGGYAKISVSASTSIPIVKEVTPPGLKLGVSGGMDPETRILSGTPRDVAVSLTAVTDPMGRQIARLVVLRDVTERKRTERQLRDLLDEQTRLSETLRQSLRPASLPSVPGLRLAARSVPSARGGGVGGDFYDVHPAGDGVSAFVLGDVSGKGVHAAVVTSMARYTVRTLSAQGWAPHEVLEQLNRALQTPDDLERFCTVVYGHIRPVSADEPMEDVMSSDAGVGTSMPVAGPDGGSRAEAARAEHAWPARKAPAPEAPTAGVRLVLTLGGHPPPLLLRRDRTVQPVGIPGTVLGLLPEVDVHEVTVDLASGDVLLAYTDGVTEARDGDEQFGEERLAKVLAAVDHDSAKDPETQLADAVADAVLRAVRAFSSERDDVALLVLAVT